MLMVMETAALHDLFERVITPVLPPTVEGVRQVITQVAVLENVLASVRTAALVALQRLTVQAEDIYASAARVPLSQADRVHKHGQILARIPLLASSFAAGELSSSHVEVFAKVFRQATSAVREQLIGNAANLVTFGASTTAVALGKEIAAFTRSVEDEADAEKRLVRQKRAARLKMWVDSETGMGRLSGSFDPETFRLLHGRIVREAEARFHALTPEHCPDDPIERQQFLRAHALAALIAGDDASTAGGGAAEVVVVHHQSAGEVNIDWGLTGLQLPDSSLDRILASRARIFDVHVRAGEIRAPGQLNLGRTNRLANRAQRRALSALHSTCCYPGCDVAYWQTRLHHVVYWYHGGRTDLNNLVPLCSHHHTLVHQHDTQIDVLPGRKIVFTNTDHEPGEATGPPLAA